MPRRNSWFSLGMNAWALSYEAATVMSLRTMKIAAGGAAGEAETQLMFAEKMGAAAALQFKALSGALGMTPAAIAANTQRHYRRPVRANRRRLGKV